MKRIKSPTGTLKLKTKKSPGDSKTQTLKQSLYILLLRGNVNRPGLIDSLVYLHAYFFILFIVKVKLFHAIGRLALIGTEHELCLAYCSVGINIVYQLVVLLRFGMNTMFINPFGFEK